MNRARNDGRVNTAVRIPEETWARLKKAADERELSVNFLINRAIEDFLPRLVPMEEFSLVRKD